MPSNVHTVPKRILSSLIASVSAGVVPRAGAPYMAIGRNDEITALLSDLERISESEGAIRFIIGRYGSGKSFLIQLVRGYALEKDFVTADADLSPERRLYGTNGSGIATYRELIKNMASKSSPDGGALSKLISKWIFFSPKNKAEWESVSSKKNGLKILIKNEVQKVKMSLIYL